MSDNNNFKVMMTLEKAFPKDYAGSTHMMISGLASCGVVDQHNDRVAKSAIEAFKKAIDEGISRDGQWSPIPLRSAHGKEWNDVLGYITKADVDDHNNLWVEAELDQNSNVAKDLYTKLTIGDSRGNKPQLGLSVGGYITKASKTWDASLQKSIRVIEDILLEEISVTSRPVNAATYIEALVKSMNWDDVPPPAEEVLLKAKESSMSDQPNETVTDVDANAEQATVAAAEETAVVENTTNDVETASSAPAENAAATSASTEATSQAESVQSAPAEEVAQTDPQANDDMAATVRSLQETVARLNDVLVGLGAQSAQTTEVAKSETVEVKTDDTLQKSMGELESRMIQAISVALDQFKTDIVVPLTNELTVTKSLVEEISKQENDKSGVLLKSKSDERLSAIEAFEKSVKDAAQNKSSRSIIGLAVENAVASR